MILAKRPNILYKVDLSQKADLYKVDLSQKDIFSIKLILAKRTRILYKDYLRQKDEYSI